MANADPSFTIGEYRSRISKTRAAMEDADVDLLIVTDPSNMAWLTGYDGWSFYTHQCVLLAGDGDPVWYGRFMDGFGARRTVFMADKNIVGYPDIYVQSTERHPMDHLSGVLIEKGWDKLRIGVEKDNYYFSAKCMESLLAGLPNAAFVDTTGLVNWRRAMKSSREIMFMRNAAQIVEKMHARILEKIEPGMRKCDLVAEIYDAGIRGMPDAGGDYPAIVPMLPTGPDASAPHLTWDDKPMKAGEATFFEIAGVYRRYHCPMSRTIYLGDPPDDMRRAEAAIVEGIDAVLAVAKPGNTCEMIEEAWRTTIARYGLEKESRCGYAIGLSYPPDWGEHTMSFRRGDKSVLQTGMTFHFMPALWFDAWGLEITEPFLVTETGAETFCDYPRELLAKR